ncbi:capsid [uncultured virus]|uniref:Capsid n=1 Tax=uncultured virus TaxID=340016 RepID=A0A2K9LT46_9VIRU|nr:capsid [uncultured virus]
MPRGKIIIRKKRSYRRKPVRFVKKRAPAMSRIRTLRSKTPIGADRYMTKIVYDNQTRVNLSTPASNQFTNYDWNWNCLHNVDPAVPGTQENFPGLTAIAQQYGSYRVLGCKYRVNFQYASTSLAGAQNAPLVVGVQFQSAQGTPPTTYQQCRAMIGQPYTKFKTVSTYSPQSATLTGYLSAKKLFGSRMADYSDQLQSAFGSNPSLKLVLNTFAFDQSGFYAAAPVGATLAVGIMVRLTLYVEAYDRLTQFS